MVVIAPGPLGPSLLIIISYVHYERALILCSLQPSNDSLVIQLTPSIYQQCEATLSLLSRYRWLQFAVVTGSMPGHVYFVDVLRDLIEKNADDGWCACSSTQTYEFRCSTSLKRVHNVTELN